MTDEDALLAAILAAPEDDTLRLVYADWLDENEASVACDRCNGKGSELVRSEDRGGLKGGSWSPCPTCGGSGFVSNGYAARAEFIRLGCELATMQSAVISRLYEESNEPDPLVQHHSAMGLRQKELFDAHASRWFVASLVGMIRLVNVTLHATQAFGSGSSVAVVDRGFVDSVSCPWDAWRDHGDVILARHPVTKVRLTTWPWYETLFVDGHTRYGLLIAGQRCVLETDLIQWRAFEVAALSARWPSVREWVLPPEDRPGSGRSTTYFRRTDEVRPQDSPESPPAR